MRTSENRTPEIRRNKGPGVNCFKSHQLKSIMIICWSSKLIQIRYHGETTCTWIGLYSRYLDTIGCPNWILAHAYRTSISNDFDQSSQLLFINYLVNMKYIWLGKTFPKSAGFLCSMLESFFWSQYVVEKVIYSYFNNYISEQTKEMKIYILY